MHPLVYQTDFGLVDGAVSAMYGVAYCVAPELKIHDLTHDITPYNVWEASYRLIQTINYWPEGTVFVSVVDPGVGSDRRSVVVKTLNNRYIVTPDNGSSPTATAVGILIPLLADLFTKNGRVAFSAARPFSLT